MPHWICDGCGGHFPTHYQEHLCSNEPLYDRQEELNQFSLGLKSKIDRMIEVGTHSEFLDEYQLFILSKWAEELATWVKSHNN